MLCLCFIMVGNLGVSKDKIGEIDLYNAGTKYVFQWDCHLERQDPV